MSYLDRLREGSYISPSGAEFTFQFDELGRSGAKKAAVHELPQQDIASVQDLGGSAVHFALKIYFSGRDYDQVADAFWKALGERGPGTLRHPRWGDVPALALTYSQAESFVEGMGQAVFEVDFVHVPSASIRVATNTSAAIKSAARAASAKAAEAFERHFEIPFLADLSACKDRVLKTVRSYQATMLKIVGSSKEIAQQFQGQVTAVENQIDTLIESPEDLATSIISLIALPATTTGGIIDKIAAYAASLAALPADEPASASQAAIATLVVLSISAEAAEAAASGVLSSRAEALAAHDAVEDIFSSACEAIENYERRTSYVTDPEAMQLLIALTAQVAAYLLEASFSLRVERRVILEGAATPLELVYRFYGSLDGLDEFCDQNHLQGDMIFIVPSGTEVRYYVE